MEALAISTIQSGVQGYLPINAGEKVTIIGKDEDDNWYYCRNQLGMIGKLPTSFVRPINKISTNKSLATRPTLTPPLSPTTIHKAQNGYYDQLALSNATNELKEEEIEGLNTAQTLMGQNVNHFMNPNARNSKTNDKYNTQSESKENIDDKQTMMGHEQSNEILHFNENIDYQPGAECNNVTLMGLDSDKNERIVFTFKEGIDISHEKDQILNTNAITLMGSNHSNANQPITFIKCKANDIKKNVKINDAQTTQ
eukprot:530157_1